MPTEATTNQRPRLLLSLAGFEVTLIARFDSPPEVPSDLASRIQALRTAYEQSGHRLILNLLFLSTH